MVKFNEIESGLNPPLILRNTVKLDTMRCTGILQQECAIFKILKNIDIPYTFTCKIIAIIYTENFSYTRKLNLDTPLVIFNCFDEFQLVFIKKQKMYVSTRLNCCRNWGERQIRATNYLDSNDTLDVSISIENAREGSDYHYNIIEKTLTRLTVPVYVNGQVMHLEQYQCPLCFRVMKSLYNFLLHIRCFHINFKDESVEGITHINSIKIKSKTDNNQVNTKKPTFSFVLTNAPQEDMSNSFHIDFCSEVDGISENTDKKEVNSTQELVKCSKTDEKLADKSDLDSYNINAYVDNTKDIIDSEYQMNNNSDLLLLKSIRKLKQRIQTIPQKINFYGSITPCHLSDMLYRIKSRNNEILYDNNNFKLFTQDECNKLEKSYPVDSSIQAYPIFITGLNDKSLAKYTKNDLQNVYTQDQIQLYCYRSNSIETKTNNLTIFNDHNKIFVSTLALTPSEFLNKKFLKNTAKKFVFFRSRNTRLYDYKLANYGFLADKEYETVDYTEMLAGHLNTRINKNYRNGMISDQNYAIMKKWNTLIITNTQPGPTLEALLDVFGLVPETIKLIELLYTRGLMNSAEILYILNKRTDK